MNLRKQQVHQHSVSEPRHMPKGTSDDVKHITEQPGFRLLTALVWIRSSISGPESIQQEPDLGLLAFHHDRIVAAAEAVGWHHLDSLSKAETGLDMLRSYIDAHVQSLPALTDNTIERRKMRIEVSKKGDVEVDSTVISTGHETASARITMIPLTLHLPVVIDTISRVFIDTVPIQTSLFTTHKTSYRTQYNDARNRADISHAVPTAKEVLLYNDNGEVMEGSTSTVYFYRDGQWITPHANCGGHLGVTRRLALENGLCKQGLIKVSEVQDNERVWLSNAARGFFVGIICLDKS